VYYIYSGVYIQDLLGLIVGFYKINWIQFSNYKARYLQQFPKVGAEIVSILGVPQEKEYLAGSS